MYTVVGAGWNQDVRATDDDDTIKIISIADGRDVVDDLVSNATPRSQDDGGGRLRRRRRHRHRRRGKIPAMAYRCHGAHASPPPPQFASISHRRVCLVRSVRLPCPTLRILHGGGGGGGGEPPHVRPDLACTVRHCISNRCFGTEGCASSGVLYARSGVERAQMKVMAEAIEGGGGGGGI